MHRLLAPLFLLSIFSIPTFANFGPPYIPKDQKLAEPRLQFTGITDQPEYAFVLRYSVTYLGGIPIEVKDDKEIKITFQKTDRISVMNSLTLYALKRKDFEKRQKDDPSLKWLTEKTEGVLIAELKPLDTTIPNTLKENPLNRYQVTIKEGKLNVEQTDPKPSEEPKKSLSLQPIGVGVLSCLSLAWFGVWFWRRNSTHKS